MKGPPNHFQLKPHVSHACSIASWWIVLAIVVLSSAANATVGTVKNVSGPLFAMSESGQQRPLGVGDPFHQGETLITGIRSYARVAFSDKGETTLRPDTHLKIEHYEFVAKRGSNTKAIFVLLKGGLRSALGLTRFFGPYELKTAFATVKGDAGTGAVFSATVIPPGSWETKSIGASHESAEGLYVHVDSGSIELSNEIGLQRLNEGQSGKATSASAAPTLTLSPPVATDAPAKPTFSPDNCDNTAAPNSDPGSK